MLKFPIGQVFRVSHAQKDSRLQSPYPDLRQVTKGRHERGLDPQKGMFFFKLTRDPDGQLRRPAFIFYSSNRRRSSESNPWLDVIDADRGYALYHGDNRSRNRAPLDARGNSHFMDIVDQYADPALRDLAPPVLLFEHVVVRGKATGFRQFSGFGVPTNIRIQAQASQDGHFANLAIELALFSVDAEDGLFDWSWIDDRRDGSLSATEANRLAPRAWHTWVKHGEAALDRIRRNVLRSQVMLPSAQRNFESEGHEILAEVVSYYSSSPHQFEGLASLIAQRVLGPSCRRGWITKRSGDGGIDFVSRLDVGARFSTASLVVLGQAKVRHPDRGLVSGNDLARVTARLQRGWLGVFVTTGVFSEQAQSEVKMDGYPLVLINGQAVALELRKELAKTGLRLREILERESEWYASNVSSLPAEHVLHDRRAGYGLWHQHLASNQESSG